MKPLAISAYTVTSALGSGRAAHLRALRSASTGLRKLAFDTNTLDCWLGEVRDFDVPLRGSLADWDCRNNRLAEFALGQDGFADSVAAVRDRHGAARVGVFVGTSTSGVQHTELAYRARDPQAGLSAATLVRLIALQPYQGNYGQNTDPSGALSLRAAVALTLTGTGSFTGALAIFDSSNVQVGGRRTLDGVFNVYGALSGDFGDAWPQYKWSGATGAWEDASLQELSVRVYWTSRGQEREVVVTTLVFESQATAEETGL